MFKKVLYVLIVFVFLTGCAPKVLTQTPTVVPEEFSPVPPAETSSPIELQDPCELKDKEVDLISYQKTENDNISVVINQRDSGQLVTIAVTVFLYAPVTVTNGVTSNADVSEDVLTYFDHSSPDRLSEGIFYFPNNSSGTVDCLIGDEFSLIAVTGLFSPTENDQYIKSLVNSYQASRDTKAVMLGVTTLHDASLIDPSDPGREIHYYSNFLFDQQSWWFTIPKSQCYTLIESYKEWGTDWSQYTKLSEMCGIPDDRSRDAFAALAIDNVDFGSKTSGDFNRYYSYASGMLPSVFDLTHAQEEICPGGQVNLPGGMTGTAYESTGWIDNYGGFAFEYGIDFVVSFGEQHFFIPYGGYFVVTDSAHTPNEYALFTTCSER
jgi:hypothetical protein